EAHGRSALRARGLRLGPKHLSIRRVPHDDLRAAACGDLGTVAADSKAGDRLAGHPQELPTLGARRHVPDANAWLDRTAAVERRTRPGHDPLSIRAEGDGLDAHRPALQRKAIEVSEPTHKVPLPSAALRRAPVEQRLGQTNVIVLHLAVSP